jgi:Protein of unknown function (DUF3060)
MDQGDPEKRIAELERQLAQYRVASHDSTASQANRVDTDQGAVPMEPIECEWCKKQNEPGSTNCSICGAQLDVKNRVSDQGSNAASIPPLPQMPPPPQWSHPPAPSYPYPAAPPPAWRGSWGRFFLTIAVVLVVMIGYLLLSRLISSNSSGTTSVGGTVLRGGNETFTGSNETDVVTYNDGDISVTGGSSNVTVTGHCATLSVAGHNNRVRIDSADTVHVDGTSNNVKIASVDTINASGSNNTVAYYSGTPHITDTGSSNDTHRGF